MILLGVLLVGCSEHEETLTEPEVPADAVFTVSAADTLLSRFASFENITVKVARSEKDEGAITVTANADWLTLKTETLPEDGIISLTTTGNKGMTRREALLTFSSTTGSKATLRLYQLCLADDDENADPAAEGYLGYGYDIYQSLDNPMAVRKTHAVLSLDQLRTESSDITYELVHENRLSRTDFNIYSARSISEYATLLTNAASNTEVALMGCKQNCDQLLQVSRQEDLTVSNVAYGVMQKAVWSRTIDRGALMHLRDAGKQLFTFAFKQDLQKVTGQTGAARADALERLLEKYGTHVVVQADYGGKIDYTFTMTKTGSLRYDEELRCQAEFTLGRLPKAEWSDKQSSVLSSSKQAQGAINITGGSAATRQQLQQDVKGLGAADGLPPEHLLQWLGSINYSDHPGTDEALDVIHFEIIPLWDLFTGDLQREVMHAVLSRADLSSCKVSDAIANIDLYWIDLSKAVQFGIDDNATLSRIVYVKGVPVLNVCSEYVPMIRADERVNIAYPIYNNKVGLSLGFSGLFLGDGIHQPAYVMFDKTDCYVEPITTLTGETVLNQIGYVGGNLYPDRHQLPFQNVTPETHDDFFIYRYNGETHTTPVVKVGASFWIRRDITHGMGFTPDPNSDDDVREIMTDGTLFTRFQYDVTAQAGRFNSWSYGYDGKRWNLPQPAQVYQLFTYMGNTPKALFRGQVSGFNAQFNGYQGQADILNSNALGENAHRGKGELNIVASKSSNSVDDACLMVLDSHYRLQLIDDKTYVGEDAKQWRTNYYPVRLCRGMGYEYPSLQTIQDKYPDY